MTKKWKVGAVYELVDKTGFINNVSMNDILLPYVSDKFKVLELNEQGGVVSVEDTEFGIVSKWDDGVIITVGERKFFKRVKD